MTTTTIDALPAASSVTTADETIISQSGVAKKATLGQITGLVASFDVKGATSSITTSGTACVLPLPANAIAGDLAILIAATAYSVNPPIGWTVLDNASGAGIGGGTFTKALTAGDILAGSVTFSVTNAYPTPAFLVVTPSPSSIRTSIITRDGGGATYGVLNTTDTTPVRGDLALYFALTLNIYPIAISSGVPLLINTLVGATGSGTPTPNGDFSVLTRGNVNTSGAVKAVTYGQGATAIQASYTGIIVIKNS